MQPPPHPLPLDASWSNNTEAYIASLLSFTTTNHLFRNLCGGIHILDFLTREPDLYSTVLPPEWRKWLDDDERAIQEILDLLLRGKLGGGPAPPTSLLDFIADVKRYSLRRNFPTWKKEEDVHRNSNGSDEGKRTTATTHARPQTIGMSPKKTHEVAHFAHFISNLTDSLTHSSAQPDIVDFGSGQNYLGRTLAGQPYSKRVIAVERKHANIFGAKGMDVLAKMASKEKVMRNKKEFLRLKDALGRVEAEKAIDQGVVDSSVPVDVVKVENGAVTVQEKGNKGSITYVEHEIQDGCLDFLFSDAPTASTTSMDIKPAMNNRGNDDNTTPSTVISLHSCGNLSHHALRSLPLNPSVHAIAIIGCCYNLLTERLGPATYKHPLLRPYHPRLESTSNAHDPHGFPMSERLEKYEYIGNEQESPKGRGVRLNITARMMAVQAPYNWGPEDSEMFFTRHFYRAVLQRVLVDKGVMNPPRDNDNTNSERNTPLIVGSLRKTAFKSFPAYFHAALSKLSTDPTHGPKILASTLPTLSDNEIAAYEEKYRSAKKRLSVIWSLMAFAASVVESVVIVDRWLYLMEQGCVETAWVQVVFEYRVSPRNMVVVGVRRQDGNAEEVVM